MANDALTALKLLIVILLFMHFELRALESCSEESLGTSCCCLAGGYVILEMLVLPLRKALRAGKTSRTSETARGVLGLLELGGWPGMPPAVTLD